MLVFGTNKATPKVDEEGHAEHAGIEILAKSGQILREKFASELIQETDPSNKIGKC